jgi:hypothetical protein
MRTMVPSAIRIATRGDVDALTTLALEFLAAPPWPELYPADPASVRAYVSRIALSEDSVAFLAEVGGAPAGMIGAGLFIHPLTGRLTGKEAGWFVRPGRRASRLALDLLEEAEAWACGSGATTFEVQGPPSAALARLYARRGYRPYEVGYLRRLPC